MGLNKLAKTMTIHCFLLLLVLLPLHSEATDCTGLPDDGIVEINLQVLVDSEGGEGDDVIVVQDGPFYTCLVQGTTMGTYQQLSVILAYVVTGSSDTSLRVSRFDMDCIPFDGGIWVERSGSLNTVDGSVDYENITVLTNCSECTEDATNDHHCQG